MLNRNDLQGKPVLFRMAHGNRLHSGTIVHVDNEGFWIESQSVVNELAEDASWKRAYIPFVEKYPDPLVLFVPNASLTFLVTLKG